MSNHAPYFSVLRHSVRADMTTHKQQHDWSDAATRPWDPPITDYTLPRTVLEGMPELTHNTIIYSSPFRRCLQTAAVAAVHWNVGEIVVHPGLGEVMHRVRSCCCSPQNDKRDTIVSSYLLSEEECERTIEMASGGKVSMQRPFVGDAIPSWNETYAQSMNRLESTLRTLRNEKKSVLVVTHGDALQAAATLFLGPSATVYDLDFCALMVFLDAEPKLCYRYGVQLLEGE